MRRIRIDAPSGIWAYDLGAAMRFSAPIGTVGEKVCVFRLGTPHRLFWWAGWTGQSPTPLLERIGEEWYW